VLATALVLFFASPLALPTAIQSPAPVGMNLNGLSYYSPEIPFVDVFKTARSWIPQLVQGGPWDTGIPVATTPEGWPILGPGEAAATLMLYDFNGTHPGGVYTVLFEGTGDMVFGGNTSVLTSTPGKKTIQVQPTNGGIYLKVIASDAVDPVRNIRVLLPGFDATNYEQQLFNPIFIERLEPYGILRFMEWELANINTVANWSDRAKTTDAIQTTKKGVALEYLVELANRTGKSPWFCLPPYATDDFALQYATYVRDHLDPSIRFYLEYANEVWNTTVLGGQYATERGLAEGLSTDPIAAKNFWYSKRSVEIFEIFGGVLGASADTRMTRVLCGQAAWTLVGEQVLDFQDAYTKADVYAIAPYFGGNLGNYSTYPTTMQMSVDQILDELELQIDVKVSNWITANKALCDARGIPLMLYEAGQRMAAEGPGLLQPTLIQKIIDVNRHPRMHEVYWRFLERWTELSDGQPAVFFVSCANFSQWGAYGHLEYQSQPIQQAPKYRALRDWHVASEHVDLYGQACAGLQTTTFGAPVLGNPDFKLRVEGALANTGATLLLGLSDIQFAGIALPTPLGIPAPGCWLYTSIEFAVPTLTDSTGRAEVVLSLPMAPSLAGLNLFAQWGVQNPAANPAGATMGEGIRFQIQG